MNKILLIDDKVVVTSMYGAALPNSSAPKQVLAAVRSLLEAAPESSR